MGCRGIHLSTAIGKQLEKFARRIPLCKAIAQLAVLEALIFPPQVLCKNFKVVERKWSMVARMVTARSA